MPESEEDAPDPPLPPSLGERSGGLVLEVIQDSYRREVAAEEDVFRTLPFFATALSFLMVAVTFAARQLPGHGAFWDVCGRVRGWRSFGCAALVGLADLFLFGALVLGVLVLIPLHRAIRLRDYRRVGPEDAVIAMARGLSAASAASKDDGGAGAPTDRDVGVAAALRERLMDATAAAVMHNRDINAARYKGRSAALDLLIWSLILALAGTIFVLSVAAYRF